MSGLREHTLVSPRWTGGLYSLVRVFTALALALSLLATHDTSEPPISWVVVGGGTAWCVLIALGWGRRVAMVMLLPLFCLWLPVMSWLPVSGWADPMALGALLMLHAAVPPAPYGSLAARGRPDPAGDWEMPGWIGLAAAVVTLVLVVDAIVQPLRPLPATMFGWEQWVMAAAAFMLAFPPRILARPEASGHIRIFYDGHCGLCHGFIRFALAEDPHGDVFRFSPLQSAAFESALDEETRASLPDSIVVRTAAGEVLFRSAGILHAAARLGGGWRLLSIIAGVFPRALRDAVYDFIAAVRHRFFTRPAELCPIVPSELSERFVLDTE